MPAESPALIAHRAALAAWRAVPHAEQVARIATLAPDRPPPPDGGRARVGLWFPCLLRGGAETWQLSLARSVDPDRVAWMGGCAVGGTGATHADAMTALGAIMPVSAGPDQARDLAARCDVLITWAGLDPTPILAGIDRPPRVACVLHMPARGYGGRLPVPAGSVDRIVAVSELCLGVAPGAVVIRNAVDPARLEARRSRAEMHRLWGVPEGAKVAGYLGRLAPEKDPDAMARLAAELPDPWHVVVVGEGPLRGRLEANGSPRLRVVGADPAAGDVLNAFDRLVSPSRYESFGLSMAEAMYLGLPVIATRAGIVKLRPELARLLPDNPTGTDIADAILDDDLEVEATATRVMAARRFAREDMGVERFGREWTDLICSLARPKDVRTIPDPISQDTPKAPTLLDKAVSLGKAVVKQVAAGNPMASDEVQTERERICLACPHVLNAGATCGLCGCRLAFKRSLGTSACPEGKWLAVT